MGTDVKSANSGQAPCIVPPTSPAMPLVSLNASSDSPCFHHSRNSLYVTVPSPLSCTGGTVGSVSRKQRRRA
eukprot:scaffold282895_cov28-Tisochrysis_lutea.AAC.1